MRIERYQAYKNSQVEWLGDVPEHWETVGVKRVAKVGHKNFVDGDWIESPYITDKGIRLIQTGNVGIGIYKEKGWRYISEKTFNDLNCTEIFPDDVLICRLDGPVGRACLVPNLQVRMITSVDNTILKPSKDFEPKFIIYVMSSSLWLEWIQALCRVGGGFRFRISRSMLGELRIQKPPLSEQKAIAHYLDTKTAQIDRKIDLLTQKATLYSNLKQSLINETVTRGLDKSVPMKDSGIEWLGDVPEHWKVDKIKRITNVKRGASPRPIDDPKYFDDINGEYGWVRIEDVTRSSKYLLRTKEKLSNLGASKSVKMKPGNIFLSIAGSVGKPIITKIDCCIHDGFVYFWGLKQNSDFMFYVFNCTNIYAGIGKIGTQLNLNTEIVGGINIPIPPLPEQKMIADYLDTKTAQIDQIIQTINTQIEKLKELRKTLINDVVTGKIRIMDNG